MQISISKSPPDLPFPKPSTVKDTQTNISFLRSIQRTLDVNYSISRTQIQRQINEQMTQTEVLQEASNISLPK